MRDLSNKTESMTVCMIEGSTVRGADLENFTVTFGDGEVYNMSLSSTAIEASGVPRHQLVHEIATDLRRREVVGSKTPRPFPDVVRRVQVLLPAPKRFRSISTAFAILSWCEALLPERLRREDLGDAHEELARFVQEGRSPAQIVAKAISTSFWLLINAIREVASALAGKKSGG